MPEITIENMGAVRFIPVPEMKIVVATVTSMGEYYHVSLKDVLEKRLTPLQFDTGGMRRMNLVGLSGQGTAIRISQGSKGILKWQFIPTQQGGDAQIPLAIYHEGEVRDGVRKILHEAACASAGCDIRHLSSSFNDLRSIIYEFLPRMVGQLRGHGDLQNITDDEKATIIRKYFGMRGDRELAEISGAPLELFVGASKAFVEGDKKPLEEFGATEEIDLYSINGKKIGVGYVGMEKETDMVRFDIGEWKGEKENDSPTSSYVKVQSETEYKKARKAILRVYYPNERVPYFIAVVSDTTDTKPETFVLESVDEIVTLVKERTTSGVLRYNTDKAPLMSKVSTMAAMRTMGTVRNFIWNKDQTLDRLKDICRSYGVRGYSDKTKEEIMDLLTSKLMDWAAGQRTLQGNYIATKDSSINTRGCHSDKMDHCDVLGRVTGSVFLADKEPTILEETLNTFVALHDVLNPFEPGISWANGGTDKEKMKEISIKKAEDGE